MSTTTAPRLALRALNDARRADPLAYLSLRYSLASVISTKNQWAQEIAPEIVRRRSRPAFLTSSLFKEVGPDRVPEFREVLRSGGSEALAEAALLDACSRAGAPFKPAEAVFSYHLPPLTSIRGTFVPYFELFSARQEAIGKACTKHPNHWVLYADIKRFYPSITFGRATKAWSRACERSRLDERWVNLGHLFLKRQFALEKGLLIGPSFSHLIANLVLGELDQRMMTKFPGRYFRYVDDFAFIVPPRKKSETISFLRSRLKRLGLRLNPKKIHWMRTGKWKDNAPYQVNDYGGRPIADERWMNFIDHLKCYLMARSSMRERIKESFKEVELRIPLPRYAADTMMRGYADRFNRRRSSPAFIAQLNRLNPRQLVREGLELRAFYMRRFEIAWQELTAATGLIRRWKLSTVRFLLGRLLLVSSKQQQGAIYSTIQSAPDTAEYAAMFSALLTRDVSQVLHFGWKVAASTGQALAASDVSVTCKTRGWKSEHIEAYLTLRLSGVRIESKVAKRIHLDPRYKVLLGEKGSLEWAREPISFFRELSAMVGTQRLPDHQRLLETPADPDENWEVFVDELLGLEPT